MDSSQIKGLAIAGAILFAGYKYGNNIVKAGSLAVAAVIVAKRIPYVNAVL